MSRLLKAQLKQVKYLEGRINPDPAWVSKTRTHLLNTIAASSRLHEPHTKQPAHMPRLSLLFPKHLFMQAKPLVVAVLVFLVTAGGWTASASASNALPGDALWHIKLASEKTQIVLAGITGNDAKNLELQIKFAGRRADEIKTVSEKSEFNEEEKAKRVQEGLKKLKENLTSVTDAVKSEDNQKEVGKQAEQVNDATTQISETLKSVAGTVGEGNEPDVAAVKQAVDEVSLDVVKVAVEQANTDAERIAAEELVEEKIVSVLSDADGALDQSKEVKALIEQTDIGVTTSSTASGTPVAGATPDTTSTVSQGATSTVISSSIDASQQVQLTPKERIAAILSDVDKTSVTVQEQVAAIKVLIEAGNLLGALEKAKELKQTTTFSALKTTEIKKVVQEVTTEQQKQQQVTTDTTATTTIVAPSDTNTPAATSSLKTL